MNKEKTNMANPLGENNYADEAGVLSDLCEGKRSAWIWGLPNKNRYTK